MAFRLDRLSGRPRQHERSRHKVKKRSRRGRCRQTEIGQQEEPSHSRADRSAQRVHPIELGQPCRRTADSTQRALDQYRQRRPHADRRRSDRQGAQCAIDRRLQPPSVGRQLGTGTETGRDDAGCSLKREREDHREERHSALQTGKGSQW